MSGCIYCSSTLSLVGTQQGWYHWTNILSYIFILGFIFPLFYLMYKIVRDNRYLERNISDYSALELYTLTYLITYISACSVMVPTGLLYRGTWSQFDETALMIFICGLSFYYMQVSRRSWCVSGSPKRGVWRCGWNGNSPRGSRFWAKLWNV